MANAESKAEILRYLGHRGQAIPPELDALIDECEREMRAAAKFRAVHARYTLTPGGDGLVLGGAGLTLRGEAIARHLKGCAEAVLLAATLGVEADALIRRWERSDLTRSLVLDACATELIEEGCDALEAELRRAAEAEGLRATGRFSPGYGDLPLDLQPGVLAALNAGRRIGLTCTDSLILLPRKSVTAILGLGREVDAAPAGCAHRCDTCSLRETCRFRASKGVN